METSDQPKPREISLEQLNEILEQHKRWVETEEKEGKRANLENKILKDANLQNANLSWANLKKAFLLGTNLKMASLSGTNLQETTLSFANFREANLYEANLKNSKLYGTQLQDAILQNADLTNVVGLVGGQLARSNVSGAKLPKDILKFETLSNVAEASKNARKLFLGMLAGCVYSCLTIATTTDARLLTNSATSPLPIIRTEIPIAGFFLVAPIVLLCVYLYSHIYLQRLWEGLAELPAIFPDGRALHKRAYPWLLTGLVCAHFKLLKSNRPPLSRLQVLLSVLLAWGLFR